MQLQARTVENVAMPLDLLSLASRARLPDYGVRLFQAHATRICARFFEHIKAMLDVAQFKLNARQIVYHRASRTS